MHKSFASLDELFGYIQEDKERQGANSSLHNRYPVRFVLFENFVDFNEFITNRPEGIFKYALDTLLEDGYPDTIVSYSALAQEIKSMVAKLPANDFVIYPFSEMARFYPQREFVSLIKSIRLKQPPEDSQIEHVRLYIPIVGMLNKMSQFVSDSQTFVWEYKGQSERGLYTLVISNGTTYGVAGLEQRYSVVASLAEWLSLWAKGENVKRTIICSSPMIYDNAHYAQPDNAFNYIECHNAFEFLTKGLQLNFGQTPEPREEDLKYWEQLAGQIDVTTFDFDTFICERFDTFNLHDSIDFIKKWNECDSDFDRWLLTLYYRKISNGAGYVNFVLSKCNNLSTSELFSNIATAIFDTPLFPSDMIERKRAMQLASSRNVKLTEIAEAHLDAKLKAIAVNPEQGMYIVKQLLTSLSESERRLMVQWVGDGQLTLSDIRDIFPDLYHYLKPMTLSQLGEENQWVNKYFDAYRQSKLAGRINAEVEQSIQSLNATPSSFMNWRDNFKTVRTILLEREDVDVYYWIDGLGVDWIPFIIEVINEHAKENVYLNEVYIASAVEPTTTSKNRPILQSLLPEGKALPKIGDLDTFAHSHKCYPKYIIDEMEMVRKAIRSVLAQYNGKKIAFVSDHGVTYLSQYSKGLKIAGLTYDHEGRLATATKKIAADDKYLVLEDGKTICSLTHASLGDKVDKGHGAHGGCTPEEILVPIIIVSSNKNASNYSVKIIKDEVDGTNPVIEFQIKGLNSIDSLELEYNGAMYSLTKVYNDIYRSERLNLVDTATRVIVKIGKEFKSIHNIHVSTGATEEDLFGF